MAYMILLLMIGILHDFIRELPKNKGPFSLGVLRIRSRVLGSILRSPHISEIQDLG